jgi:Leucine-rich repeat (LRR) protein
MVGSGSSWRLARALRWLLILTLGACGGRSEVGVGLFETEEAAGRGGAGGVGGTTGGSGAVGGRTASGGTGTGGDAGSAAFGGASGGVSGAGAVGQAGFSSGGVRPAGGGAGAGSGPIGGAAGAPTCTPKSLDTHVVAFTQDDLTVLNGVTDAADINISGDVTDLAPLSCLARANHFIVSNASSLGSLKGLERLENVFSLTLGRTSVVDLDALVALHTVDSTLSIYDNPALRSVAGLSALSSLRSLDVTGNPLLKSLLGLSGVRELVRLDISESALETLEGLEGLVSLQSATVVENWDLLEASLPAVVSSELLTMSDNPKLHLLELGALESATNLLLSRNAFTSVDLRGLSSVSGTLDLANNDLTDVEGFESLREVGGVLTLAGNPLVSVDGLLGLERASDINLSDTLIADLDGLASLWSLLTLGLETCPNLASLEGLSNLSALELLSVSGSPELTELTGLEALEQLGGLFLRDLPALTNVDALSGVVTMDVLTLENLPALTNLDGLDGVVSADIEMMLMDLPALESIQGLTGITGAAWLELERTGVIDLLGFQNLENVANAFALRENPALTNLRALTSLSYAGGIFVTDNPELPTCEAEWLLDRTSLGSFEIYGNDDGGVCPP